MKKILAIVVGGMVMISGFTPVFADSNLKGNHDFDDYEKLSAEEMMDDEDLDWEECDDADEECFEYPSFEELMKDGELGDEINKADLEKLEKLYNEAVKLEKEEKYEEAEKQWEAFDKIFGKYIEYPSFEEIMKDEEITENINKADLEKLEKLYNEAIELEKEGKQEEAEKQWEAFDKILEKNIEYPSFKEIMKDEEMNENINKADLEKLEKLYNEAVKLEKEEKYEEAEEKWEAFDKIFGKYVEYPSFEEIIKDEEIGEEIDKADQEQLEKLYNEAVKLEKEEKHEDAEEKWEAFDEILEKYFSDDI